MKVCLHTNWEVKPNYIGGTERFLVHLAKELKRIGYDVFIVCSSHIDECVVEGIKVIGSLGDPKRNLKSKYGYFSSKLLKNEIIGERLTEDSLRSLSQYTFEQLRGVDADVFHLNSFISASFLNLDKPFVVTNHENNLEYDWYWGSGFFNDFCSLVERKKTNLHKVLHLFTPSEFYARYFSDKFGLSVSSVRLGVSLDDFPLKQRLKLVKEEHGIEGETPVILLPSRFQPHQKGHDIALKAAEILKNKRVDFCMLFTGVKKSSEKYRAGFNDLVEELGLRQNVKVITFADMNEAYNIADVIISPERFCSYGLSISESLALGKTTVLSDIPTYKEVAEGTPHGHFFESESAEDLSDKILSALGSNDVEKIDILKFRLENDFRICTARYAKIYHNVIQKKALSA